MNEESKIEFEAKLNVSVDAVIENIQISKQKLPDIVAKTREDPVMQKPIRQITGG